MKDQSITGKKQWHQPELLVIVRSHPEENVLASCKGPGSSGPGFSHDNCKHGNGGGQGNGSACHEVANS